MRHFIDLCLKLPVKHIVCLVFCYSLEKLAFLNILVYFKIDQFYNTPSSILLVVVIGINLLKLQEIFNGLGVIFNGNVKSLACSFKHYELQ